MVTAVSSALIPAVVSSGIFAARRFNKGCDNINETPMYGLMNLGISACQGYKAFQALDGVAATSNMSAWRALSSVQKEIKNISGASEFLSKTGHTVKRASYHVNPLIIIASGVKVLSSEDKADTFARESVALCGMFGFEHIAKKILGKPKVIHNIIADTVKEIPRTPLHKSLPKPAKEFVENCISKVYKFCGERKLFGKYSLTGVPAVMKGLAFVAASIAGYEIGEWAANKLFGEKKENLKAA